MNREFLKEAIADAKAVKESAIANAKVALEEAFSPQLQAMFASRLEEMEKEEGEEEIEEVVKAEVAKAKDSKKEVTETIEEIDDEMDLDEILAELEKDEMDEGSEEINEAEEEIEAEETETEEGEGDESEDEEIDLEDMSEDDLKKFIEDVIADMVEAGELEAGEGMEDEAGEEGDEEEMDIEVDIDAEEAELTEEKEDVEEGLFDFLKKKKAEAPVVKNDPNPIVGVDYDGNYIRKDGTMAEAKEELDEALEVIATLRSELNEINLLNAKLLYSNKIFKSKNMTESQKAKVLGAFDKATNVSEVKVVFETINENFVPTKKTVNEGVIGSASKATGFVREAKQPIVESDEMVNRFKKLAGII